VSGTNLFAGTWGGGVFLSTNNGTTWSSVNTGLTDTLVEALGVSGTNLFAATDRGVFLSTNNGTSWNAASTGLTSTGVYAFAVSGANLFAGTWGGGVFLSTNNGTSWSAANSGLTNTKVIRLAVSGTNLFAGTYGGGVFLSTNNGTSWQAVNTGLPATTNVFALTVSGTNVFAGTDTAGIWRRPISEMITSVDPATSELPRGFLLQQNYPNPFNPTTVVSYQLPVVSDVKLIVYDLLGRELAVLVKERKAPGSYEVKLDGSNLASGVYFYRLKAGTFVQTRKILLLR
jgi:hypothetical protein